MAEPTQQGWGSWLTDLFRAANEEDLRQSALRRQATGQGKPMRFDVHGRTEPIRERGASQYDIDKAVEQGSMAGGTVFKPSSVGDYKALRDLAAVNLSTAGRATSRKGPYAAGMRREAAKALENIPKEEVDFLQAVPNFVQTGIPQRPNYQVVKQYHTGPGGRDIPIRTLAVDTEKGKIGWMQTDPHVRMSPAEAKHTLGLLSDYTQSQFGKPLKDLMAEPLSESRTRYFRRLGWEGQER